MRTNREHACPTADEIAHSLQAPADAPRCRWCSNNLVAIGVFEDWLLFSCPACEVVWRVTGWEVLAASKSRSTATAAR